MDNLHKKIRVFSRERDQRHPRKIYPLGGAEKEKWDPHYVGGDDHLLVKTPAQTRPGKGGKWPVGPSREWRRVIKFWGKTMAGGGKKKKGTPEG